jgi:hypothetical protein
MRHYFHSDTHCHFFHHFIKILLSAHQYASAELRSHNAVCQFIYERVMGTRCTASRQCRSPFPSLVCHHRAHALSSHATRDEGSRTNRVNRIGTHARKYCFPFCKQKWVSNNCRHMRHVCERAKTV